MHTTSMADTFPIISDDQKLVYKGILFLFDTNIARTVFGNLTQLLWGGYHL